MWKDFLPYVRYRVRKGINHSLIVIVLESALDIFPRYGIQEIDALILSHGHADAVLGLDDLRSWTSAGSVQEMVPIYLNEETFAVVSRAFPYLVSKANATGGGEVASFKFNLIKEHETFEIAGLDILPLPGEYTTSDCAWAS